MAAIGTIQLAGNVNAGPAEVELNTLAQRYVVRPQDFGLLGAYSAGGAYTFVNAKTTAPSLVGYQAVFRNPGPLLGLIKKVSVSLILTVAGTASAGVYVVGMYRAHNVWSPFIAGAAGAASVAASQQLSQNTGVKLRTTMPDAFCDFVIPPNAASTSDREFLVPASIVSVTEFVPTIEAQPVGQIASSVPLVSGSTIVSGPIFDERVAEHPLALSPGDGFVIQVTTAPTPSAATTIDFAVTAHWEELELRTYQ